MLGDDRQQMMTESNASILKPLTFLYGVTGNQAENLTKQLLIEAYLNPKLAADLMSKATKQNIENIEVTLGKAFARGTGSSAIYAPEQ